MKLFALAVWLAGCMHLNITATIHPVAATRLHIDYQIRSERLNVLIFNILGGNLRMKVRNVRWAFNRHFYIHIFV